MPPSRIGGLWRGMEWWDDSKARCFQDNQQNIQSQKEKPDAVFLLQQQEAETHWDLWLQREAEILAEPKLGGKMKLQCD